MGELIPIIALTFVVPLWLLLHYVTRWKQTRGLSTDEQKMLEDLWESAERMESRIRSLETILDSDHPEWRSKS